ncbi:hypothetical protein ACWIBQ_11345 [Microbacterium keratanolyticum]
MRASTLVWAASGLLALEGAALVIIALLELFGLGAGNAASIPTAIALIVLTLIAGVGLVAFAVGVLRGKGWARSGGVAVQALAIATAFSALSVQPLPWAFVLGVGGSGLVGLVLLISVARRAGAQESRRRLSDDETH